MVSVRLDSGRVGSVGSVWFWFWVWVDSASCRSFIVRTSSPSGRFADYSSTDFDSYSDPTPISQTSLFLSLFFCFHKNVPGKRHFICVCL